MPTPYRKQPKELKQLEWFNLNNYARLKKLEPMDLYLTIKTRIDLFNQMKSIEQIGIEKNDWILEKMFNRPFDEHQRLKDEFHSIMTNPLLFKKPIEPPFNEERERMKAKRHGSISEFDWMDLNVITEFLNKEPPPNEDIEESFEELMSRPLGHAINVNLNAPEAQIIADFKDWLKVTRKAKVSTPKRQFEQYQQGLITHKVLPYIDILIYKLIYQIELNRASTLNLLEMTDSEKTFENDTQKKANQILNETGYLTWIRTTCQKATP